MSNERKEILPTTTKEETALDLGATLANLAPWIGNPVASVLTGFSRDRKMSRVADALSTMYEKIHDLESVASEYVKTDQFQDLLEVGLRQVQLEGNSEKRIIYGLLLAEDIASCGENYDERQRFLRVLEEIQPTHISMLRAIIEKPRVVPPGSVGGSIGETLRRRLPDMPRDKIKDILEQLGNMHLIRPPSLGTIMTANGAENLHSLLTPFGQKFVNYLMILPRNNTYLMHTDYASEEIDVIQASDREKKPKQFNSELVSEYVDMLEKKYVSSENVELLLTEIRHEARKVYGNKKIDEEDIPAVEKLVGYTCNLMVKEEALREKGLNILYLLTKAPQAMPLIKRTCYGHLKELYDDGGRNKDLLKILDLLGNFKDKPDELMKSIDNLDLGLFKFMVSEIDLGEVQDKWELVRQLLMKKDDLTVKIKAVEAYQPELEEMRNKIDDLVRKLSD